MAATIDQQLGNTQQPAGGATITLTTANAVASGGFIEIVSEWFGLASAPTITVSGGSLTWTQDKLFNSSNNYGVALHSAQAPSGLASSTAIQASYSATPGENYISGVSFTGVATSAAGQETASNSDLSGTTATWSSSATAALAFNSHVTGAGIGGTGTGSATPTSPYLEVPTTAGDWNNGTAGISAEIVYRTDGTAGNTYNAGGTFGGNGNWYGIAVAYKDAAAAAAALFLDQTAFHELGPSDQFGPNPFMDDSEPVTSFLGFIIDKIQTLLQAMNRSSNW